MPPVSAKCVQEKNDINGEMKKIYILNCISKTVPTHALTIKTIMVLKNKPYICFGQLTGHHQGQLAITA
jgi:hypothetical protein